MPDYRRDNYGNHPERNRDRERNDAYSQRSSRNARDNREYASYDNTRERNARSTRDGGVRGSSTYNNRTYGSSAYGDRGSYGSRGAARNTSRNAAREASHSRAASNPYSRDHYTQGGRMPMNDPSAGRSTASSYSAASNYSAGRASAGRSSTGRTVIDGRNTRSGGNPDARRQTPSSEETVIARQGRTSAGSAQNASSGRRAETGRAATGASAGTSSRGYSDLTRYLDTPQRSINPAMIAVPILVIALVAFGIFQIVNPKTYDITINGAVHTVERGTTIDTVLEAGYARPAAGDLLAVDGAVLQAGGGERFTAVVNGGEPTSDGTTPLKKKTVVEITDGADVMEPFTETTETIPYERVEDENYWNGSMHIYIPGSDGVRATRTGDYSGITITEDTTPVVHNQWKIYHADTGGDKVIALTFDDGPWANTTEAILDILDQYNAKATFFTVGYRVADYPDLIKRMQSSGHQICTHSWDHANGSGQGVNLTYMSSEEQIEEIEKGVKAIEDVTGTTASRVIRAPGGNFYGDIIWTLQPYITAEIGWDIDTQDWRLPGADAIAEQILKAKAGDVILMHDGGGNRTQTVEALRMALPKLVEEGYTFVTVDELLAYGTPQSA